MLKSRLIIALGVLALCLGGAHVRADDAATFSLAIQDAATQNRANVWDGLFALSENNPKLIRDKDGRVMVLSFMSQASYQKYWSAKSGNTSPDEPRTWVTLVPELHDFCHATGLKNDALALRLKQWLGLNPVSAYEVLVELWVQPEALFRPCPDPETGDAACNVNFPMVNGMPVAPTVTGLGTNYAGKTYVDFFASTYAGAYPDGAPWTRLGYTYDWKIGTPKFGGSEYMIKADAPYVRGGAFSPNDYCVSLR